MICLIVNEKKEDACKFLIKLEKNLKELCLKYKVTNRSSLDMYDKILTYTEEIEEIYKEKNKFKKLIMLEKALLREMEEKKIPIGSAKQKKITEITKIKEFLRNDEKKITEIAEKEKEIEKKIEILTHSTTAVDKILKESLLIIILGGDGTIIKTLHTLQIYFSLETKKKYFLSVNYPRKSNGNKGGFIGNISYAHDREEKTLKFLQDYQQSTGKDSAGNFKKLLDKKTEWHTLQKFLIHAEFDPSQKWHGFENKKYLNFINEIYIETKRHREVAGIFTIRIDEKKIAEISADGILISTPTGSTGYNLSKNGPIVLKETPIMIMKFFAVHGRISNHIIVPAGSEIGIVCSEKCTFLGDGKTFFRANASNLPPKYFSFLEKNTNVKISLKKSQIKFVQHKDFYYCQFLQEKLQWTLTTKKK